jgi:phosphohistidine phosphatase
MKRLTLLRHAKSSWDDPGARDIERPLNARGRRAARAMGQAMRAEHLHFDLIVASPAVRVVETLEEVGQSYGASLVPHFDERLYLASVDTLLAIARETDDEVGHLLFVGHNPSLERFALFLTAPTGDRLRSKLNEKYPTGALAEIRLPIRHWRETEPGEGELVRFVRPRDLDPDLGPDGS